MNWQQIIQILIPLLIRVLQSIQNLPVEAQRQFIENMMADDLNAARHHQDFQPFNPDDPYSQTSQSPQSQQSQQDQEGNPDPNAQIGKDT